MCALSRVSISIAALAYFALVFLGTTRGGSRVPAAAWIPAAAWGVALAARFTADNLRPRCDCEDRCGPESGLLAIVLALAAIMMQALLDHLAMGLGDCLVVVGFSLLGRDARPHAVPSARARYRR